MVASISHATPRSENPALKRAGRRTPKGRKAEKSMQMGETVPRGQQLQLDARPLDPHRGRRG